MYKVIQAQPWVVAIRMDGTKTTRRFECKDDALYWGHQVFFEWRPATLSDDVLVGQWGQKYLVYAMQAGSNRTSLKKLEVFLRLAENIDLAKEITKFKQSDALRHLNKLSKENSPEVAFADWKILKVAWRWGVKAMDLPAKNPFEAVQMQWCGRWIGQLPSVEDFWKAFELAGKADQLFLLMVLLGGFRDKDLLKLRWEDVDFDQKRVQLGRNNPETGQEEYSWQSLREELSVALSRHKEDATGSYVFSKPRVDKPYSSKDDMLRRICRRAGIVNFSFEDVIRWRFINQYGENRNLQFSVMLEKAHSALGDSRWQGFGEFISEKQRQARAKSQNQKVNR